MIARGFKSVIWVAAVGGAALGCYMVSLRVATERAELAKVERQILLAKSDIRSLETELGTRGRMTQLEDWNSNVLALSAPNSAQYVKDRVMLASLEQHGASIGEQAAEVRMASDETGAAATPEAAAKPAPRVVPAIAPAPPRPATPMVHQASYTTTIGPAPAAPKKAPAPAPAAKPVVTAAATAPAKKAAAAAPAAPAARKTVTASATAKPKPVKVAAAEAPAPTKPAKAAAKPAKSVKPVVAASVPAPAKKAPSPAKIASSAPARAASTTTPASRGSGRAGK
jgi:hypothetical protein